MRKDIEGYEGMYQIDTDGNVWSIKYNKCKKRKLGKDKVGYLHIDLWKNDKRTMFKVHRLVALSFIPNPENKPQVNHINGIKTDNRVENLEWVTALENHRHSSKLGLKAKGERHGSSKLKDSDIPNIFRLTKLGYSQPKIADLYGVSQPAIWSVLNRKTFKHIEIKY